MIGGCPMLGIRGSEAQRTCDRRDVEHRRRQRRDEEAVERIQHAHHRRGEGEQRQERQHDAREVGRQCQLAGDEAELGGDRAGDGRGEQNPEQRQHACHDEQRIHDQAAEPPRGVTTLQAQDASKGRYEGGGHGPFGEQVTQEIRYPEGDVESVHLGPGTEHCGQHGFPGDAEHAAGHGRNADEPGGAGDARRHREGPNCVTNIKRSAYHSVRK
jgi:hypothetical protein